MTAHIKGLKCDNPECNYVNKKIKFEDYENYILFPCPKCGKPLLTRADYDAIVLIKALVDVIASDPQYKDEVETHKLKLNMNGNGFLGIEAEIEELNKEDEKDE